MRARLFERDETVPAMMTTLRDRYLNRPGGYTRIIPSGNRPGDNAPTAILELVDSEGEFKLELAARELGRKVFEEELSVHPLLLVSARSSRQKDSGGWSAHPPYSSGRALFRLDALRGRGAHRARFGTGEKEGMLSSS